MGTKLNWLTSSRKSVGLCVPCGATVSPRPTESASNLLYQVYSTHPTTNGLRCSDCPSTRLVSSCHDNYGGVFAASNPCRPLHQTHSKTHSAFCIATSGPFSLCNRRCPSFFSRLSRLLLQSNCMPMASMTSLDPSIPPPTYQLCSLCCLMACCFMLGRAMPCHAMI
jgi:hypothetical protein